MNIKLNDAHVSLTAQRIYHQHRTQCHVGLRTYNASLLASRLNQTPRCSYKICQDQTPWVVAPTWLRR